MVPYSLKRLTSHQKLKPLVYYGNNLIFDKTKLISNRMLFSLSSNCFKFMSHRTMFFIRYLSWSENRQVTFDKPSGELSNAGYRSSLLHLACCFCLLPAGERRYLPSVRSKLAQTKAIHTCSNVRSFVR